MLRLKQFLPILGWLVVLAWPLLVWFSLTSGQRWLLPILACLFLLRLLALWGQAGSLQQASKWIALAGVLLSVASLLLNNLALLMWYPVVVNAVMLMLFAGSLWTSQPLIERLARLREAHLPPKAIIYTRKVTCVWSLFFVLNGSIAAATCLAENFQWWLWWNGLISYLLIGTLMACEWLLRQHVRKKHET